MTVLCDWCRHSPAFYAHLNKGEKMKCGMNYPEMKGRSEDCTDFNPETEMLIELAKEGKWAEFVQFYGDPHPHIAELLRPSAKRRA